MCSIIFLKEILKGEKKLLLLTQVKSIPTIPRLPEIDIRHFLNDLKNNIQFFQYFPSVYKNPDRVPDRTYFFTVFLEDFCNNL